MTNCTGAGFLYLMTDFPLIPFMTSEQSLLERCVYPILLILAAAP